MGFLKVGLARGVFFHAGKIKSTNSTGPLETEQWVNVTLDTMGMYVFSIYQNKVVQRHASLLDSREQISEKKTITINKPQGFSEIKIQQIGVHLE